MSFLEKIRIPKLPDFAVTFGSMDQSWLRGPGVSEAIFRRFCVDVLPPICQGTVRKQPGISTRFRQIEFACDILYEIKAR